MIWFGYPLRSGLSERTLADFELPATGEARDEDGIHRLLVDSCARLLGTNRPVIVPLSGGLDSRLVLATLLELLPAADVHAFTYGFAGHLDFAIAPMVARAAGVHHVQRGFHEITFDPDEFDALVGSFDLEGAPHHNLYSYYYTRKITELCLRDLPSSAPIWSGFIGDRVWSGKWLERPRQHLSVAASEYARFHAHAAKLRLVRGRYDPAARLESLYRGRSLLAGSSWCELFDLQQRQYYVKRSLKLVERPYVFPLATPEICAALLGLPIGTRARRRFYRGYLLRHHRALFELPTSAAFGAPLRGSRWREEVDRALRLIRQRLERVSRVRVGRFEARRYDARLVAETWPAHTERVRRGLDETRRALAELGMEPDLDIEETLKSRAVSQVLGSLGVLLRSEPTAVG